MHNTFVLDLNRIAFLAILLGSLCSNVRKKSEYSFSIIPIFIMEIRRNSSKNVRTLMVTLLRSFHFCTSILLPVHCTFFSFLSIVAIHELYCVVTLVCVTHRALPCTDTHTQHSTAHHSAHVNLCFSPPLIHFCTHIAKIYWSATSHKGMRNVWRRWRSRQLPSVLVHLKLFHIREQIVYISLFHERLALHC